MAELITLQTAHDLVLQEVNTLLASETVALDSCLGRRLAQDLHADSPWPSTDRSAMDGFAVVAGAAGADGLAAGVSLQVVGESLAGHPYNGPAVKPGQAIRIMTGAVVPETVDAVVPVENTSGYAGGQVSLQEAVQAGANIRPMGSEVAKGDLLMAKGILIRPAEVGALAVLGLDPVPVFRKAKVAILATGDEVVDIQQQPKAFQVRNSNAHALAAQVRQAGCEPLLLGIAGDNEVELSNLLQRGLAEADVLLTIGGVSKGTHDLVHGLLKALGVQQIFHGVAIKPGKPTFFGRQDAQFVFGLPGNPASCFTIFDLMVRPLLSKLAGGQPSLDMGGKGGMAKVCGIPFKKNWRLQAIPSQLQLSADGSLQAQLASSKPSGDPFSLLSAKAYALVPQSAAPADTPLVALLPYATE